MFTENKAKDPGRGSSQKQVLARECHAMKRRAKSYSEALRYGQIFKEANIDDHDDIILSKNARHKIPKRFSKMIWSSVEERLIIRINSRNFNRNSQLLQ